MDTMVYRILPDGGFVVGDTKTRITSYAYPTSSFAVAAKTGPERTAREMIRLEGRGPPMPEYDCPNWRMLDG